MSFDFIFIPWNPTDTGFISSYTVEPDGTVEPTTRPPLGFSNTEGGPGQQRKYFGGPATAIPVIIEDGVASIFDDSLSFFFSETCTRLDNTQEFWQCDGHFNDMTQFGCNGTISYQGFLQEVKGSADPTLNGEYAFTGGSLDFNGIQGNMTDSQENIALAGSPEPAEFRRVRRFQSVF